MTGIERRFSDDTRLIDLTVGELKTLIESLAPKTQVIEEKKYVYGYKGLASLLNCSICAAKNLVVDTQLVFELLQKTNNDRRSR